MLWYLGDWMISKLSSQPGMSLLRFITLKLKKSGREQERNEAQNFFKIFF